MWKHRVFGGMAATLGAAMICTLLIVVYRPEEPYVRLTFAMGLPGALMVMLAGIVLLVFGASACVAPRATLAHAANLSRGLRSRVPPGRKMPVRP